MRKTAFAAAAAILLASAAAFAQAPKEITWKKITLTDKFYAEGAYYADFNKDGKMDVVYGPYWYEGPDFTKKHMIYPPTGNQEGKPFDPKGYSDNFLTFCYDFNGDGYPDVLVYGHPGTAAILYLNPGADVDGQWKKIIVHDAADNESQGLADIDGIGKPQGLFHTGGFLGYARPDYTDLTKKWTFVPISPKGKWQRYTHGYGAGNIAGHTDKKLDIVTSDGWWENPGKELATGETWKFHPVKFAAEGAQMLVYDVDGDGLNDVITAWNCHGYGLVWWKQVKDEKGEITFKENIILDPKTGEGVGAAKGVKFTQPHALDLVDVDGDGLKDFVTGKRWWAHGPGGDIDPMSDPVLYWFQLKRNPDKTVDWIPHLVDKASGVGTQVTGADLNGDGIADFVVGNKRGGFVFLSQKP
ncbi:MAG: FG-GAP repeat domain-containing protein [Tepidisphaerales bacterium]